MKLNKSLVFLSLLLCVPAATHADEMDQFKARIEREVKTPIKDVDEKKAGNLAVSKTKEDLEKFSANTLAQIQKKQEKKEDVKVLEDGYRLYRRALTIARRRTLFDQTYGDHESKGLNEFCERTVYQFTHFSDLTAEQAQAKEKQAG